MSNASSESDGSNSGFITPKRNKRLRHTPPADNPKRSVPAHTKNTVLYGKKFSPSATANKFASLKVKSDSEHSDNNSDSSQNLANRTISDPDTTPTQETMTSMDTGGTPEPTIKDVFEAIMSTRNELAKLTSDQAQTFAIHQQAIAEANNKVYN